ncbi:MAG: helix-turn-helix transcriptional regulator [bacterium]|nr:helix-turn-helix transcriptional regulator [bacterium]
MNLIDALYFTKKHFQFNNEKLANYLGISKQELARIFAGHRGINSLTLKRVSQILRISMDELVENKFVLPFYHFSKHIYSVYVKADRNYPDFYIQKGDYLYIRPFVDGPDKKGQLILVYASISKSYTVEKYSGDFNDYLEHGKLIHYHIVGKSSILYQPYDDIEFQVELIEHSKKKTRKRGRPIKTVNR